MKDWYLQTLNNHSLVENYRAVTSVHPQGKKPFDDKIIFNYDDAMILVVLYFMMWGLYFIFTCMLMDLTYPIFNCINDSENIQKMKSGAVSDDESPFKSEDDLPVVGQYSDAIKRKGRPLMIVLLIVCLIDGLRLYIRT